MLCSCCKYCSCLNSWCKRQGRFHNEYPSHCLLYQQNISGERKVVPEANETSCPVIDLSLYFKCKHEIAFFPSLAPKYVIWKQQSYFRIAETKCLDCSHCCVRRIRKGNLMFRVRIQFTSDV